MIPMIRILTRTSVPVVARSLTLVPSASAAAARAVSQSTQLVAPEMQQTQQRTTQKHRPMRGIPIEHATTATDPDDGYTLGQSAHMSQNESSFTDVKIGDVLAGKAKYGDSLHSVKCSDSVQTALQTMNHFNIGAILVTADDDPKSIVGIFSTRDFIKRVDDDAKPIDTKRIKVEELMSHDPVFAYADTNAIQCMNMMNSGGFRHLPIRDRATNKTVGLVSVGDLVRTMMKDYADKNSYLEELVNGKYSA